MTYAVVNPVTMQSSRFLQAPREPQHNWRLIPQNTLMNKTYLLDSLPASVSTEYEIGKMTTPPLILCYQICYPTAKVLSTEYCLIFFNLKAFQAQIHQWAHVHRISFWRSASSWHLCKIEAWDRDRAILSSWDLCNLFYGHHSNLDLFWSVI